MNSFTPEHNARIGEAVAILVESDERWTQFLAQVKALTDERTVQEVLVLEARAQRGEMTDDEASVAMARILHEGFTRKIVGEFVEGFVDKMLKERAEE